MNSHNIELEELMKTNDVRVGQSYLYNGEKVNVIKRIRGRKKNKMNLHSGIVPTGEVRTRKRFLLSNGLEVFSDKLKPIIEG